MSAAAAGCPSAEELVAFAGGALDGDPAATIESHIDVCGPCRAALSMVVKGRAGAARLGRYRLDTVLGSGGMGIVYRAHDPELDRAVAIKVLLRAGEGAGVRDRLRREARSLARLSHPNVCHVYDVGVDGDEVWIAMELVDGTTLRAWLGDGRPAAEIGAVLMGAARGIAAAHAAGLVHRDVKPENVLVTRDGRAVVTDFGLARVDVGVAPTTPAGASGATVTASGAIAGTPAYMAPEQLTGAAIDARADQFAWAVTAWEAWTGARPFPAEPAARVAAVRAGVIAPAALPAAVGAALVRALAEAPRDRFPSMEALIEAIEGGAAARGRRRARAAAIAGAGVLAAGGLVVAAVAWRGGAGSGAAAGSDPEVVAGVAAPEPARAQAAAAPAMAAPIARVVPAPIAPPAAPASPPPGARPRIATAPAPAPVLPAPRAARARPRIATAPAPAPVLPAPRAARARPTSALWHPIDPAFAESSLAFECSLPVDPAHPDPHLRQPVADWGRVTRWADVDATMAGRPVRLELFEIAGARRTYLVDGLAHEQTLGFLDAAAGDLAIVCPGDDVDLYQLPAPWKGPVTATGALARIGAPPRLATDPGLAAFDLGERALGRAAARGAWPLDDDRRVTFRAAPAARVAGGWDMGAWTLEVGADVRGADHLAAGHTVWIVADHPRFVDGGDAGHPRLVLRAVAVVEHMLPRP